MDKHVQFNTALLILRLLTQQPASPQKPEARGRTGLRNRFLKRPPQITSADSILGEIYTGKTTAERAEERKGARLTHGLQVDVDKVEPIVLQSVMRFSRYVQVAVVLLVAQVHLDP